MNRFAILLFFLFPLLLLGQSTPGDSLAIAFKNPPSSAKPKTWMHAMSGNMSEVGMTKDLEAIAAAGQGGVLLFNIANRIPYGDIPYNSDAHHKIITHAAKECERLDLSFGVHNCDGWTSSGGPWITPEQSMKMVVWSQAIVSGGKVKTELALPPTREGFYRDIAVLAYPTFPEEMTDAAASPALIASDSKFDISVARDGSDEKSSLLQKEGESDPHITFDFGKPHTISSLRASYFGEDLKAALEISQDGENFELAESFNRPTRLGKKNRVFSKQFDPVTARYFRMTFEKSINIREIDLSATRPFHNFMGYSGLGNPGNYLDIIEGSPTDLVINKESIINVTGSMNEQGILDVELPEGNWTVMRFGYSSTGASNWPASKWGKGLECDKFSRSAFKAHFDAFSKKVIDNTKAIAPNAVQYIEIDSYEMGGQNWTEAFEAYFKSKKGYDIIPFLPVFAGRIVESKEVVSGFTFDINEIFCDLMTKNYFDYFTELCNEHGLKSYVEPYGAGPVSTLDISKNIDLPMTEFWVNRANQKRLTGTIHGAHIYGKNVISAEAFTSRPEVNWKMHPAQAKIWGDMAWVTGVNEFMFHRFVHQANTNVKPGLTMGTWGSHIDRTQHWWMNAGKAWFEYITRGSYLLRHGYPVADVLVFSGDQPRKDGFKRKDLKVELPNGINYDCTNADALLNRISIEDQSLVLPEGNAYRFLVLQNMGLSTLPTLRRIKEIAAAGIPVIGEKPVRLAGLQVSTQEQEEFNDLISEIWNMPNCFQDYDFTTVTPDFIVKDYDRGFIHRKSEDADIYFFYNDREEKVSYESAFRVNGKIPERWDPHTGERKKLANFSTEENRTKVWMDLEPLESAFIVFSQSSGDLDPVVTPTEHLTFTIDENSNVVSLVDEPGTYKVKLGSGKEIEFEVEAINPEIDLSSSWEVEFLEENDHQAKVHFDDLKDWKDHADENIKYYSGTAIYTKSFDLPSKPLSNDQYILDLGEVNIAAEVFVNGIPAGVLWMKPFRVDISSYLEDGANDLTIKVTNQWTNKLIGDERYPEQAAGYELSGYIPSDDSKMPDWYINNESIPEGPRTTFDSGQFYQKGDDLLPSGLLGPVTLSNKKKVIIK